jgi:putative oxidoreductase
MPAMVPAQGRLSARVGGVNGIDVARLGLRVTIGATMIAHGVRHGRTLDGTARWFSSIGFRQPRLQAMASAAVETGTGVALIAGAGTPVAASAVVGTLAVAARTVHLPNGFFITKEGYEYVLNLSVASVALAALGPGDLSVDRLLGIHEKLTPARRAALAAGLGLGAAALQLAAFWRAPVPAEPAPASPVPASPVPASPVPASPVPESE